MEWKGLPCAEPFLCARLCAGGWRDHGEGDSNRTTDMLAEKQDPQRWGPAQPMQGGHGYPRWLGASLFAWHLRMIMEWAGRESER